MLLTTMLVVPWYVLAELRTPGFLEYFLVGEHWHRFVTTDGSGDLYGNAHAFPRGSIWLFAIAAFLPWSVLIPVASLRWRRTAAPAPAVDRPLQLYLLLWRSLPACLQLGREHPLTYVLPGLPALSMLLALWLARVPQGRRSIDCSPTVPPSWCSASALPSWPSTSAAGAKRVHA